MNTLDTARIPAENALAQLTDIEFVAFDTETTGLSPVTAKLVELSGVRFRLGQDVLDTFSCLINPDCAIPYEATRVHGITNDMVADAGGAPEVVASFFDWIKDAVLLAHNATFDLGFLRVAANRARLPLPASRVIDTLRLSRQLIQDSPNHQLGTLVRHLQLPAGGYHRALADSHHVRNLIAKMIDMHQLTAWHQICEITSILMLPEEQEAVQMSSEELHGFIEMINSAISENNALTFRYNGMRTRARRVRPQAVIQNRGNFYLTAFCYHFEAERTFRLDKISHLNLLTVS